MEASRASVLEGSCQGEEWRKAGGESSNDSLRLSEMWESIAQVVGKMP
jgi:hypothetical protein